MPDTPNKLQNIGIVTSYIIGLPIGLTTIALVLSGEGAAAFGLAIVGLIAAFIFSLWYAGKSIADNLQKGGGLLQTSFTYSLTVNKIIWGVFIILIIVQNPGLSSLLFIIPPILAFLLCVSLTTISIGLLISWIVSRRIKTIFGNDPFEEMDPWRQL